MAWTKSSGQTGFLCGRGGRGELFIDRTKLLSLISQLISKLEIAALARPIGCEASVRFVEPLAKALLFLVKPSKRMFKTRNRAQRRDRDR